MIGILSNKLNNNFLNNLGLEYGLIDNFNPKNLPILNGLFIDWVSKVSGNEVAWVKQASLLQTYIKSEIPIVIFDREMSLTEKEVNWCKKFNTYLFEPYINSGRNHFTYLPEWIDFTKILIDDNKEFDKEFDVVYSYNKIEHQLEEFERWIKDYARLFPEKKVAYETNEISDFKKEEFKKDNLIESNSDYLYGKGNITIAIDIKKHYKIGYFDNRYFYAMNYGCLPLLPINHKYFHGLFKGLIIEDLNDMDYFVSTIKNKNIREIMIEEIFDRINTQWNEFKIEHAIDVISNCFK